MPRVNWAKPALARAFWWLELTFGSFTNLIASTFVVLQSKKSTPSFNTTSYAATPFQFIFWLRHVLFNATWSIIWTTIWLALLANKPALNTAIWGVDLSTLPTLNERAIAEPVKCLVLFKYGRAVLGMLCRDLDKPYVADSHMPPTYTTVDSLTLGK